MDQTTSLWPIRRKEIQLISHPPRKQKMTNAETTIAFFKAISKKTKNNILKAIADHYGCSIDQALNEVINPEAECLMDYLVGPVRSATYVIFQKHGFSL